MQQYDIELDKMRAKLIAHEVSKIFGDGSGESGGTPASIDADTAVW